MHLCSKLLYENGKTSSVYGALPAEAFCCYGYSIVAEIFPLQRGTCAVSSRWLMLDVKVVRLVCSELHLDKASFGVSYCP